MAVKSKQSAGIVATIFTSLVAPTLVALVTTAIKDTPVRRAAPSDQSTATETASPAPAPPVTLLPPTPVEQRPVVIHSAYRWQPAAVAPMADRPRGVR